MKRIPGLLLFLLLLSQACFATHGVKAILLAGRDTQKDTIGYNIVDDMARYMYTWIDSGQVKLWDSPEKKHQISRTDLQGIESSTGTAFNNLPSLFIYETWNYTKREYGFNIRGFSFVGQNTKGEDVLYGYVDMNDALKQLLMNAYLSVNMRASYGTTLWQALMNKRYDFDLLFFDDSPIKDIRKSQHIKKTAIGTNKKMLNHVYVPSARLVEYVIESGPSPLSERSVYLAKQLETFFNENRQEFYNYGGDKIYSYLKNTPVLISDIHVLELLTIKNDVLYGKTLLITPYVLGLPMQPIPIKQFEEWKLSLDGHSWEAELDSKDFYFTIVKINDTLVPKEVAETGKANLYSKNWSKILPETQ